MKRVALGLAVALGAACASPAAPPGGPDDAMPPTLVGVTPDSGAVRARPDEAVFRFDEVISETATGGGLADLVLVSPSDGRPDVRWRRNAISVRPRNGWRTNTTYVVTLLPGVTDLDNNRRDSTTVLVFSTGDSIPRTRLTGVAFDWTRGTPAGRAYVQARPANDTSLTFATEADSVGRFTLPFLSPGTYLVRALIDANRNRMTDPRELWDSTRVDLRDTARVELYAFSRDTIAPRVSAVAVADSLTVRVTFDKPLSPDSGYLPTVEIMTTDSVPVGIARVSPWVRLAELRDARAAAIRDSAERADTSTARRAAREQARRDSINRAAAIADSIARDPSPRPPPPEPSRPTLVSEIGVELQLPLVAGDSYVLRVTARGVLGGTRMSERVFSRPAPPATPPPARTDTTGARTDTTTARTDTAGTHNSPTTASHIPRSEPAPTLAQRPRR